MQYLSYWFVGSDQDWVTLEIWAQLPGGYEQRKSNFFKSLIIHLSTLQSPGNKVNGELIISLFSDQHSTYGFICNREIEYQCIAHN
jgi:hypothetical protein